MSEVLVLNFTYEALNVTSFQRAVKLIFAGKAEMLHGRERILASPTFEMRMPSIIRMLYYIRRPMQRVALTKKNVLIRDEHACQYCGTRGERLMTVDHVVPKSRGGDSTWENLVCACMRCNNRKNNRTPHEAANRASRSTSPGFRSSATRCPTNGASSSSCTTSQSTNASKPRLPRRNPAQAVRL